jgi:hypothetical protein
MYYYEVKRGLPLRVGRSYIFVCFKMGFIKMFYIYNYMAIRIGKSTLFCLDCSVTISTLYALYLENKLFQKTEPN